MSLTSYRAAPPRVSENILRPASRNAFGGVGGPGGDLLFRGLSRSTIGAEGFHFRVRDGIGCFAPRDGHQAGQPRVRGSGTGSRGSGWLMPGLRSAARRGRTKRVVRVSLRGGVCRAVSDPWFLIAGTWFWPLGAGARSAIERLVPLGCAGCPASTCGLSTWWSTTALGETWF